MASNAYQRENEKDFWSSYEVFLNDTRVKMVWNYNKFQVHVKFHVSYVDQKPHIVLS